MRRWMLLAVVAGLVGCTSTTIRRENLIVPGEWPDVYSPSGLGSATKAYEQLDRIHALAGEDLDEHPADPADPDVTALRKLLGHVRASAIDCRDHHEAFHAGLGTDGRDWHADLVFFARKNAEYAEEDGIPIERKLVVWRIVFDELEHLEGTERE